MLHSISETVGHSVSTSGLSTKAVSKICSSQAFVYKMIYQIRKRIGSLCHSKHTNYMCCFFPPIMKVPSTFHIKSSLWTEAPAKFKVFVRMMKQALQCCDANSTSYTYVFNVMTHVPKRWDLCHNAHLITVFPLPFHPQ